MATEKKNTPENWFPSLAGAADKKNLSKVAFPS